MVVVADGVAVDLEEDEVVGVDIEEVSVDEDGEAFVDVAAVVDITRITERERVKQKVTRQDTVGGNQGKRSLRPGEKTILE